MKKETVLKKKLIPGSKVSVSVLIDYISEGYSLTEFLSDYPWIKRDQIEETLNELKMKDYPIRYAF